MFSEKNLSLLNATKLILKDLSLCVWMFLPACICVHHMYMPVGSSGTGVTDVGDLGPLHDQQVLLTIELLFSSKLSF